MRIARLILLFFAWLSVDFICVDSAIAWSGRIVDKETKKPIEGAVIVRSWDRENLGFEITSSLVALDETMSNDNGDFSISKWKGFFRISVPIISKVHENKSVIYKPGYKLVETFDKPDLIELERISNNYYLRNEENDYAYSAGYYNFEINETKIFKKIVDDEKIKIKHLERYINGVIFKGFTDEKIYLSIPIDIEFDSSGNICILDEKFNREIKVFDVNGYYINSININTHLESFGSIYFDYNDDIYLSSSRYFLKFYKDRKYIGFKNYGEQLNFLQGLDFSSNDGLYFIVRNFNLFNTAYRNKFSIINFEKNLNCSYNYNDEKIYDVDANNYKFYTICISSKNNFYVTDVFIDKFDNKCMLLSRNKIENKYVPTCFVVGDNEVIVSDRYNLYFYDKDYNLKYTENFDTGFGRPGNNKNSYLGAMDISNIKADKGWNYLYIIDSKYERILKYNIKTRSWAQKGEKIISKKVEQTKKTFNFVEGVNGIGWSH